MKRNNKLLYSVAQTKDPKNPMRRHLANIASANRRQCLIPAAAEACTNEASRASANRVAKRAGTAGKTVYRKVFA